MHGFASPIPTASTLVVKFGGNAMNEAAEAALLDEVSTLSRDGVRVVLVHGGGPQIDAELEAKNIPTVRVRGLRATDAATLTVTEAVLCATINKKLVRALLSRDVNAIGVSGEDARLLQCEKLSDELGYVGTVTSVNASLLTTLLDASFVPVIAPLGVAANGSTAYNVNGDTAAGAIAGALAADAFVLVTNVSQVRRDPDDPSSGIDRMSFEEAKVFAASDACRDSMRPKMDALLEALRDGAKRAIVCAPGETTIASALKGTGTTVTPSR